MEIRQFQYFLSVAKHLNFTAAAKECYIAQQALSQQIMAMEAELGLALFNRDNRKVQLTPAGKVLVEEATRLLEVYHWAQDKAKAAAVGMTGSLNIGYVRTPPHVVEANMVRAFLESNPHIALNFEEDYTLALINGLSHRLYDAIMVGTFQISSNPDILTATLFNAVVHVAMSTGHPLAQQKVLSFDQLQDEVVLMLDSELALNTKQQTLSHFAANGFEPQKTRLVKNITTQRLLAAAGAGICFTPYHGKSPRTVDGLRYTPVSGKQDEISICIAWAKDNINPALPHYIQAAQDYYETLR